MALKDGQFYKTHDPSIYLVQDGVTTKRHVPDMPTMAFLGLMWTDVEGADADQLVALGDGAEIPSIAGTPYMIAVDSVFCHRSRSTYTDDVYVTISATIDGWPAFTTTRFIGKVNDKSGRHGVDLGLIVSVPEGSLLTFSYLATNNGGNGSAKKRLDELSAAGKTIVEAEYPLGPVWGYVDQIHQWLNGLIAGGQCNGVVAGQKFSMTSQEIIDHIGGGTGFTETDKHPGTDSPVGCGANSNYDVTWTLKTNFDPVDRQSEVQ